MSGEAASGTPNSPPAGAAARRPSRALAAAAAGLAFYAGLCKALLFRDLEYYHSDLFSSLEMTWSWLRAGRFLHDNAYGDHAAIHGFYLLPALAPLTVPLGGYGLVLALTGLNAVAAWRAARATELAAPGRLALLAGLLGPIAFFVFDNPVWGFHPELLYPPLAVLLALDLAGSRWRRALLPALAMLLVKEDGPVVCAAVGLAVLPARYPELRGAPPRARRRALVAGACVMLALAVAFGAGMALLARRGEPLRAEQDTVQTRVGRSLRITGATLAGEASPFHRERLGNGLLAYLTVGALVLLPSGRRLPRAALAAALALPAVVAVLVVSSALYRFQLMTWPPRLATLLAALLACVVSGALGEARRPGRRALATAAALCVLAWALQAAWLTNAGYRLAPRLALPSLAAGRGTRAQSIAPAELAFARCVAGRLPGGLPVTTPLHVRPVFHRQSIVIPELAAHAWHAPRLQLVEGASEPPAGWCSGPRRGGLAIAAECDLVAAVAPCGR
jgi:hypothetical protein